MDLQIKLTDITQEQLFYVCCALDFEYPHPPIEMRKKLLAYYSILNDVRVKLQKKYISTKEKKKFSIKLKYHEANTLYETLNTLGFEPIAQPVYNQLHQQLI